MLTLVYDTFVNKVVMPAFKKSEQTEVYEDAKAGLALICGNKVTIADFQLFEAINYLNILGNAQGMSDSSKCF